ncbi:MAG: carbon storage regulator [Oscillospiraceae bacterium]|nr:carbon storage regulator [Oscillospiraceae bacterium]
MLVITRKKDEGIFIGDDIKVTVIEIAKDRIRIGIDAPSDVKIVRNELRDTEKLNVQAAVNKPSADFLANIMANKK